MLLAPPGAPRTRNTGWGARRRCKTAALRGCQYAVRCRCSAATDVANMSRCWYAGWCTVLIIVRTVCAGQLQRLPGLLQVCRRYDDALHAWWHTDIQGHSVKIVVLSCPGASGMRTGMTYLLHMRAVAPHPGPVHDKISRGIPLDT